MHMITSAVELEICIPALDEEAVIEETVRHVRAALESLSRSYCVTVVDNGSRDATAARARAAGARVMSLAERGKGRAIVAAAQASEARVFGFIDADLSADPHDIAPLYAAVAAGTCDIAIGSRLLDTTHVRRSLPRTLSSHLFNGLRRAILGIRAKDTQCGLKVMNERGRMLLAAGEEVGWFFDVELLARAEQSSLVVREIAIHWEEHRYPNRKSRLRMLRDGFGAIVAMLRIRRRLSSSS